MTSLPQRHSSNAIKGILFDKDGTLLDFHATWIPAYEAAAMAVCMESGKPDFVPDLMQAAGFDPVTQRCDPESPLACGTNEQIARIWGETSDFNDVGALIDLMETVFEKEVAAKPVPVNGLAVLLRRLVEQGQVLGVATMDCEAQAHAVLNQLRLADCFSFVCGYDSGFGVKPGPGMVEAFSARTGLAPRQVAVVGDTPHDLNMARAADVGLVIGVLTGASPRAVLAGLADHVLADITELESLI
ncbi:MAG: HAD family hydrolase [Gammaproteobacteria bacterium]|nr:HAD family hydrolase [Gammaproteobacteria bacterium]